MMYNVERDIVWAFLWSCLSVRSSRHSMSARLLDLLPAVASEAVATEEEAGIAGKEGGGDSECTRVLAARRTKVFLSVAAISDSVQIAEDL